MAEFGMTVVNGVNELTISSEGFTYGYIGKASLVSVLQAGGSSNVKTGGRSTYTIEWAGDIIVALPLATNGLTGLLTTTQSGSTWTIRVVKGNGSSDAQGFDVQEATDVYVFGAPASVSGFGMALYNSAGTLSADFSRRPMLYKARFNLGTNVISWTPTVSLSSCAIVGMPSDNYISSTHTPLPFYTNRWHHRGWQINVSTGQLQRLPYQTLWSVSDGPDAHVDIVRPVSAFLVDITGLT